VNVCFWHIADVPLTLTNVCFEGKNGHDRGRDTISAYDPKRTFEQRERRVGRSLRRRLN